MVNKLQLKTKKTIYSFSHDRFLAKSHTIVQIFMGIELAFLGIMATYIIEGKHELSDNLILYILVGTSIILSVGFFLYLNTRMRRFAIIENICKLSSKSVKS